MKNHKPIWVGFAILLVLILSLQPTAVLFGQEQNAYAASTETVKFKIINKSEEPLRVTLQGPRTYYLNATVGTNKYDLLPGTYTYSYIAYGTYTEGNLDITKDGIQLRIASQAVRVRINNKTGVPLTLRLQGPQSKNVTVEPGKTKIEVWKGSYDYSYTAFGLFKNGTAVFQSNGAELVLEKLTANLKIVNRSGAQVRLSLSGAKPYTFGVPTGQTKTEVIKGKYTYSYLDHGVYETGEINIQSEQASLTLPNQIATLKIANQSGADVQVSLQGKLPYFLSAAAGTSKHEIRRGSYQYKYYACGKWQSGDLQVNKNTVDLKIASCQSAASGEVKVVIVNDTSGLLRLHLTGPQEYWLSFSPGTETVFVAKGKYDYTAWGCGGASKSGTRNITSKLKWRFWCQ